MNRLTERWYDGDAHWAEGSENICELVSYGDCSDCDCCPLNAVLERLCRYEETGFEPDEINKLASIAIYNAADLIEKLDGITK